MQLSSGATRCINDDAGGDSGRGRSQRAPAGRATPDGYYGRRVWRESARRGTEAHEAEVHGPRDTGRGWGSATDARARLLTAPAVAQLCSVTCRPSYPWDLLVRRMRQM